MKDDKARTYLPLNWLVLPGQTAPMDCKDSRGFTPLYHAAKKGRLDRVKLLVEEGHADVDVTNGPNGETALHAACRKGRADVVRYLIVTGNRRKVQGFFVVRMYKCYFLPS